MRVKAKQKSKHSVPFAERIPAWLVIACGLAAMLLVAFGVPAIVLRLQDNAQLSATSQGTRESVNVDFMDVEELEVWEKLQRVAKNGEQLYTITTSQTMTRDEQLTFLQNVRDTNDSFISALETILQKPLLEPYDTEMEEIVQYVVLDEDANYLFSVCYVTFPDYEDCTVQLLADRNDYVLYGASFTGNIYYENWFNNLEAVGYDPEIWASVAFMEQWGTDTPEPVVEDIYQATGCEKDIFQTSAYGDFTYEADVDVGQDGEECRLEFLLSLVFTFYEENNDTGELQSLEKYYLNYGFPPIAKLIESAYGEAIELEPAYGAGTNAEAY